MDKLEMIFGDIHDMLVDGGYDELIGDKLDVCVNEIINMLDDKGYIK